MATKTVQAVAKPAEKFVAEALFQPVDRGDIPESKSNIAVRLGVDFADQAMAITAGVTLLLEIMERDSVDQYCTDSDGNDIPRLLNDYHTGIAQRMCITALKLLHRQAEETGGLLTESARSAVVSHV